MTQNKVVAIISKPPRLRHSSDIKDVLPWLRKKSDLLSGCKDDVLEDIVRNCDYHRAVKDDVIVTQGDIGDCFYIMLSGKTSVYIDTTKSDDDGESANQIQEPDSSRSLGSTSDKLGDAEEDSEELDESAITKKKKLDRSKYGKFIIHFEDGKSFGEIALISEDSVRNATVISDEDTDMLLIHRDLFNRSVKAQQEKDYQERKDFISGCRLFGDWSSKFKHLLEMSIRKEVYPFGTAIMKQGDQVDGLFFIVSGQAKMTTEPSKHHQQYPKLTTTVSLMEQEFGRHVKENTKKGDSSLTQHQIRIRRKEGYAAAEKRFMSKSVDLCCVEGKEILGDMEVVMEMGTYACTVTCTADTTVFILDNKTYERLILKKNVQTITALKHGVLKKAQSRLATHKGASVQLLKLVHDKLAEELKPKRKVLAPKTHPEDPNKQAMLAQMIKLYLKDKTPMIDPILPDAFHARLMSERKNRMIAKLDKKKEERALYLSQKRRRVPRSLKQLQNSAAETELMNPDKMWYDTPKPSKDRVIRPKTAIGIESRSNNDTNSFVQRPETAQPPSVFHLTECEPLEDTGNAIVKDKPVMVTQEYNHMFQQIDNLHREKSEARSKVICSVAAKNEIRSETERSNIGYKADNIYDMNEDEYFDYETSEPNLKQLEERIKHFCDRVSKRRINDPIRVNMMKSFHVKNVDSVPLSGGTVFVNRKPCAYPRNARVASDVHQHVRRFMITRDINPYTSSSVSMNARPKSAFASTSARSKSAW